MPGKGRGVGRRPLSPLAVDFYLFSDEALFIQSLTAATTSGSGFNAYGIRIADFPSASLDADVVYRFRQPRRNP
jgi:hypothetical protein